MFQSDREQEDESQNSHQCVKCATRQIEATERNRLSQTPFSHSGRGQ